MAQTWVIALVAIAIAHLVATVALYHWLGRQTVEDDSTVANDSTDEAETATAPVESDEVVCSNCGTHNAAEYRYCRQCVSPLGSARHRSGNDSGPDSPWIR